MLDSLREVDAANGDLVRASDMPTALSAGTLGFGDGATQVFTPNGHTTYIDHGQPTKGEWSVVEDGKFLSFWPPSYRATYVVRWLVEGGEVAGLSFVETQHGSRFDGRYR